MRELTITEMEIVSGGVDWDEVSGGLAFVGTGIALVAAAPEVGTVVVAAGAAAVILGGFAIGDGLVEGGALSSGGGEDGDGN
ncbi:hypothetical protein [Methylomonas rosea]|uniref:Bacteriocin n=1 Tax=Methylomonas rosea TaxID=2952227 RepID=A0ABT1TQU8_9GAMM|nr:hypothetical protein [Methylomonas sp. WSC-7]MCQ8116418.1 hypothetical protein [Methylomonas sp. WSC-7]